MKRLLLVLCLVLSAHSVFADNPDTTHSISARIASLSAYVHDNYAASSGQNIVVASWVSILNTGLTASLTADVALLKLEYASLSAEVASNALLIPTNASFTLHGLGEHSYNSLTDKPVFGTLASASSLSYGSLTDLPTFGSMASITNSYWNIANRPSFGSMASASVSDYAATSTVPLNASFTLSGLGEKLFSSLVGVPTNASWTLAGLSEHLYSSLAGAPTAASWTLAGLGEHLYLSLNGAPTSASWTYGLLQGKPTFGTLASSSASIPINSDFTLAGLSEKSFENLTDKPTLTSLNLSTYTGPIGGAQHVASSAAIPGVGSFSFAQLSAGTVPVASGGTGAIGSTAACVNLGCPQIKVKTLTGTTTGVGTTYTIAHGLTASKILSVSAIVDVGGMAYIFPDDSINGAAYLYDTYISGGNIAVGIGASATGIAARPITILIFYSE